MSEAPSFENLESQTEWIVAHVSKTLKQMLEDNGFFSVSVGDLETNSKFIFLEKKLSDLLISDNLARYFRGLAENDSRAPEIINNLRNAILLKANALFVPGEDFIGRFNQECQAIIEGLMIKKF